MSDPSTDFQHIFLNNLVSKQVPVAIHLKNGIKLKGTLRGFDEKSLLLGEPSTQVIYKSSVSTIAPLVALAKTEET